GSEIPGWNPLSGECGFRVVCGSAAPTRDPLPDPEDGRPALAFLVRAAGDDADLLVLRGDLHGRYGDLRSAAADYARAVKASPPRADLWCDYAPLLIQAGDRDGYRALRPRLLDEYGTTTDPVVAERVAKACLLVEGGDLDRVMRLITTALGGGGAGFEVSPSYPLSLLPYAQLVRGMAEYRGGKHAAALDSLKRSLQAPMWSGFGPPVPGPGEEAQALRGLVLAMAYHPPGDGATTPPA